MLPNIGLGELGLIFLVALLVVGPNRLPEIARALGKAYQTFNRETSRAKDAFREVFDEPTKELRELAGELRSNANEVTKTADDARSMFRNPGVVDRPDGAVPVAGAPVDPVVPAVGAPEAPLSQAPVDPHPRPSSPAPGAPPIVEHPTNPVVRDYEDT